MIQRKKSLATYCREKALRNAATGSGSKSAVLSRKGAQDGGQATRKPRAGLKRVSSKRAKENRIYTERRKAFLIAHPFCQIRMGDCTDLAMDIHHAAGRAGSFLLNERWWFSTCRNCHDWCHQHSNTARELGFIAPRGA